MFSKIFGAIKSLFSSLFGGGGTTETKKPDPTTNKPEIEDIPQDGSEITPDTVVVVANEMEEIVINSSDNDIEFDEDIFADPEDSTTEEPKEEPEPEVEEPVVEPEPEVQKPKGRYLWCLDNGHGSKTAGKRSPVFDDGETQLFEYEFNRDIVKRIMDALDKEEISYFNVVPEVDIDNFLQGRVDRANAKKSELPKLYLSIHSNAAPAQNSRSWGSSGVHGIETWYYHGSKKGQKIASVFQRKIVEKTGWRSRGLKSKPKGQFFVLKKTRMTAVLTENGFYNNKAQAAELMKDEVRQQIADAHIEAILEIEKNGL